MEYICLKNKELNKLEIKKGELENCHSLVKTQHNQWGIKKHSA